MFINLGSAVTGPEVYLKALSMARNVARQQLKTLTQFTTAVFDLVDLPVGYRQGPPSKEHPMYYYRPWKTILVRTVCSSLRSSTPWGQRMAERPLSLRLAGMCC